jgi:hypothetical protein
MNFLYKLYRNFFNIQNKIISEYQVLNSAPRFMIQPGPFKESGLDNSLREKLINFYVDGNPVNLLPRDVLFREAALFAVLTQSCSIDALRREFSVCIKRARHIMDQLESAGIIRHFYEKDSRKVLVKDEASLRRILNRLPEIDINDCIDQLDSFYENNETEIELRKAGSEKERINELHQSKLEAVKLLLTGKMLTKGTPDHEQKRLIKTGREF